MKSDASRAKSTRCLIAIGLVGTLSGCVASASDLARDKVADSADAISDRLQALFAESPTASDISSEDLSEIGFDLRDLTRDELQKLGEIGTAVYTLDSHGSSIQIRMIIAERAQTGGGWWAEDVRAYTCVLYRGHLGASTEVDAESAQCPDEIVENLYLIRSGEFIPFDRL